MNKYILQLIAIFILNGLSGQIISGDLAQLANQEIRLEGFSGLKTYPIAKTKLDKKGSFKLKYTLSDYGVGYLISSDNKPFFVILSGEDIRIKGEALSLSETIKIIDGEENKFFEQYATEHPRREQALSAWNYLNKIYNSDSLFSVQDTPREAIFKEKRRIKAEDSTFLANLPKESYVKWYLPTRKLVSNVSTVAQHQTEQIPATIEAFRGLDYTDDRLYKSGLFKDAIESHFWLIENSGRPLDSVFFEMQISIDAMIENLVMDEKKLNEVTDYLFDLLERHSLFKASEYLAVKLLNEESCTLDDDLAKQLETYRAMKKGNTAPDIEFKDDIIAPGYSKKELPNKLSKLNNNYTLVVFGASWCPKCAEELPEIAKHYAKWKKEEVEVVFVSLDDDKNTFKSFANDFPYISICDYKKWKSPIVDEYYVFATPTMFLLDSDLEILLRPKSVKQMNAWVDWYLVEGNILPKKRQETE